MATSTRIDDAPSFLGGAARIAAAALVALPLLLAAQQSEISADRDLENASGSASIVPPRPTLGWVLEDNQGKIPAQFGSAALLSTGQGASPMVAADGAGNIDGAALIGGVPSGAPLSHYALSSGSDASFALGTTVLLLCGRENNWLRGRNGEPVSTIATGITWSVSKPNEWGLNLASTISTFAVASGGVWVSAKPAPAPATYAPFEAAPRFPPPSANSPVCVWALYDTAIRGSSSRPEISTAYDDGAASAPVTLARPVGESGSPLELLLGQMGADLGTLFIWQGQAAVPLFQQSVRAAYWNGGLRRLIRSGFQTEPWSGLAVTNLDPRPIAEGGDAEDNTRADRYATFVRTSPFARYSVTTAPGTPFLAVRYRLGNYPYLPIEYSVSFAIDGEYAGYDQPWRPGPNLRSIPLPQDGRSHTVELRNGFTRNNGNYSAPTAGLFGGGGFIDAVAVPKGYKLTVNHPVPKSVALVLSHSVAVGEGASATPFDDQGPKSSVAWPVQARELHAFGTTSVVNESYAGELLANDCWSLKDCTGYLAAIRKAQPYVKVGFVARMLNDFYHGRQAYKECLDEYERTLDNLIAAWAKEFPRVPLYVGSDIRETASREKLTDGCADAKKLADWRQGIKDTVDSYAAENDAKWLHFVDMSEWVPQDEIQSGGVHPTTQGQIRLCQAVADYFHQPVTCGVPH